MSCAGARNERSRSSPNSTPAFTKQLGALVGNETLLEQLKSINERLLVFRMIDFEAADRVKNTCAQHLDILERIGARDAGRRARSDATKHWRRPQHRRQVDQGGARARLQSVMSARELSHALCGPLTGAGAPAGDFAGAIAAVHRRVCVISLVDESPLTLATLEIGRLPRGITLDAPPEFTFHGIVARSVDIAARGGILRIGGGALSIDLRPATPWRSRLGDLSLDGAREAVTQALEIARAALRQDGRGEALVRIAGARLGALSTARRERSMSPPPATPCRLWSASARA